MKEMGQAREQVTGWTRSWEDKELVKHAGIF